MLRVISSGRTRLSGQALALLMEPDRSIRIAASPEGQASPGMPEADALRPPVFVFPAAQLRQWAVPANTSTGGRTEQQVCI